jgi:hypothetical protein
MLARATRSGAEGFSHAREIFRANDYCSMVTASLDELMAVILLWIDHA